jgi:putative transposase
MPRPPRIQLEDGIYHVATRGNRRGPIFLSGDDRELFLRILRRVVLRHGWELHAFCQMTNHYHLVLTTREPNLSAGMCVLNGHYARAFNEIHGLTGHVFERRFHAEIVSTERHMLALSSYVVANPVRARLCRWPEQWAWSSYAATVFWADPPDYLAVDRLLAQFGDTRRAARQAYREYVEERLRLHATG